MATTSKHFAEGDLIKQGPTTHMTRGLTVNPPELFGSGLIGEFVKGSGQYVILPKGTRLLKGIISLLKKGLIDRLGFEEVVLPKIAPEDSFRKAGVIGKWDNYLVSVIPFSSTQGLKERYLADPLQCTSFYQFHENHRIHIQDSPIKWCDCSGPSYRNEDSDKLLPAVKQREFHRAEFIYMGTPTQVLRTREECLRQLELMCQSLSLNYRIVVGSGCYQSNKDEPNLQRKSIVPIKDLEVYCPGYKHCSQGRWDKKRGGYLELAGSSVLGDQLTSRFNIKDEQGKQVWSGCTGIGLDRLMYALVSNHGSDLDKMPTSLQKVMKL